MNRYYDSGLHRTALKILPGEYAIARPTDVLVTVLGSCVSACIRDVRHGIGGMNHFMLPVSKGSGTSDASDGFSTAARYGVHAMELLVNALLKNGSQRRDLSVKVFGGAAVLGKVTTLDIGRANGEFVKRFVSAEGLNLDAQDLFGEFPRKIYFFPDNGDVRVKYLRTLKNETVSQRERDYASSIQPELELPVEMFTWPNQSAS